MKIVKGSRKKTLLKVLVILIVFSFMGSSVAISVGHSSSNYVLSSKPVSNLSNFDHLAQSDNAPNAGNVNYTLASNATSTNNGLAAVDSTGGSLTLSLGISSQPISSVRGFDPVFWQGPQIVVGENTSGGVGLNSVLSSQSNDATSIISIGISSQKYSAIDIQNIKNASELNQSGGANLSFSMHAAAGDLLVILVAGYTQTYNGFWTNQNPTLNIPEIYLNGTYTQLSGGVWTSVGASYAYINQTGTYTVESNFSSNEGGAAVIGVLIGPSGVNYPVSFSKSGLPSGTSWSVTLNGTTESSTTNTITFSEPNGTYFYDVGNITGWTVSPSSGNIQVSSHNQSIVIQFSAISWQYSPAFKITTIYNQANISIGYWFIKQNFSLPLTIYTLTNASGITQAQFMQNLTKWFGFNLDLSNNRIPSVSALTILSVNGVLSFAQKLNSIYNDTVGILNPTNFYSLINGELYNGNLTLFAGISFNMTGTLYQLIQDTLISALKGVISTLKGNPVNTLTDLVNILENTIGDHVNVAVGNLVGQENNIKTGIYLSVTGIINEIQSFINQIKNDVTVGTDFIFDLAEAAGDIAIGDIPSAVIDFGSGIVNGIDLALNLIAPNNAVTVGWNWVTSIVDPNGTTILPSVYQNGKVVLGYENGKFNWSSSAGIVIQTGNEWFVMDTNITNSSFLLTHVGLNNTVVPYTTSIFKTGVNGTEASGVLINNVNMSSNVSVDDVNGYIYANWTGIVDIPYINYTVQNGILHYKGDIEKNNAPISSMITVYENGQFNRYINATDGYFNGSITLFKNSTLLTFEPGSNMGFGRSHSISVSIAYYKVDLTESGLPSGATWYVNITGGKSFSSTNSTISFVDPNGTYSYTVATTDKEYAPSPSSGSLTVNGASVSKSVTFSKVTYTVTFTESGLPSGTSWYVNLSNGQTFKSTTSTLSFSEPNGTYSYTVGAISGYTVSSSTGSVTVNGANLTKTITFASISTSLPVWAFAGAYVNYTMSQNNKTSTEHGYVYFKVISVNTTTQMIEIFSKEYNGTATTSYYSNTSWNGLSFAFAVNHTVLSMLNNGTSSALFSGATVKNNVTLSTPMGTFTTDEIITSSSTSSGGQEKIYVDRQAGIMVSISISSSTGNISAEITSTNIPTSAQKSSGISLSSVELYGIIGTVAAVAVIGSVVAIMRRKK